MSQLRCILTDLIDRIDRHEISHDDLFVLGMIAMVAKTPKSCSSIKEDDSEAIRCLTLGWLIQSMFTDGAKEPENEL